MGPVQIVQGNQHTLGDAITNLMTTLQGKKDKQDAQDEQQARILAQQFVTLPADVQAANFQSLPEAAQKYVLNRTGYAPHKDTAEEALNTRRAQEGLKGWDDPASLGPGGINAARYQAATDKAAPTELTQANVANAVYNNDPKLGLAPQMQARQGIADKSVMEAKDAAANTLALDKFNQIERPKNVAEIGHLGAQTAEQYAAAGNQNAQAGYHKAQTVNELSDGTASAVGAGPDAPVMVNGVSVSPAVVKMIVNRDYDPRMMMRWKPEQQSAILTLVRQKDPGFNMNDYPTQAKAKANFTAGEAAKSVRSINQLIGHIGALDAAGKKLGNSDYPSYNAVANFVGDQAGNRDIQAHLGAYDKAAGAVANEFETMMRGSAQSTGSERADVQASLNHNIPPAKRDAAIRQMLELMQSRLTELDDQYTKGVGRQRDFKILNPGAKATLKRWGIDGEAIDPDGGNASGKPAQSGGKQLDANTAAQILQQAGGDKNKARQIAASQGYSF